MCIGYSVRLTCQFSVVDVFESGVFAGRSALPLPLPPSGPPEPLRQQMQFEDGLCWLQQRHCELAAALLPAAC